MEVDSLNENAYRIIRNKIRTCELPPGTLLSIYKLAESLKMSRTPISSAIARLEKEDLVAPLKNRGVLVKEHTPRALIEIFQINYAYQILVLRIVENDENYHFDLNELSEILHKQQEAKERQDYISYVQLSLQFLYSFISVIDNERILTHVAANIDKIMIMAVHIYNSSPNKRIYSGLDFNRSMLEAIEKRDFGLAQKHADDYFRKTRERVVLKS